ncbi:protein D1-like isoform X2 [Topomyia yanbarensis]|uniref:protein D1-like isoform X2 n=1 Tax=Topomyia yanbarensis TaxID=2498891 RepID=UPI00273AC747|nr:protein D1-like isoform X2 [Topomyia yanbarensis]
MTRIMLLSTVMCILVQLQNRVTAEEVTCPAMADLQKAFTEFGVVPDVVNDAPTEIANITYPSGVSVLVGNELTPTQVKDQPKIEWSSDADSYYTLFMVDPDAPSRATPKFRSVCHWFVGNIPGSKIEDGDHRIAFVGSGPPEGSGLHRYVFLIYKQNGKIDLSDAPQTSNRSRNNRLNFQHKDFVGKYELGELVAGNFYQAQFDQYVPTLHAQLSSGSE